MFVGNATRYAVPSCLDVHLNFKFKTKDTNEIYIKIYLSVPTS